MDFTWEIIDAYIAAGYAPPFHLCKALPSLYGRKATEIQKAAVTKTLEHIEWQLKAAKEKLATF